LRPEHHHLGAGHAGQVREDLEVVGLGPGDQAGDRQREGGTRTRGDPGRLVVGQFGDPLAGEIHRLDEVDEPGRGIGHCRHRRRRHDRTTEFRQRGGGIHDPADVRTGHRVVPAR